MKKNIFTVISVVFVGLVAILYFKNKSSTDASPNGTRVAIEEMGDPAPGSAQENGGVVKPESANQTEVFPGEPSHEASGFLPTATEDPNLFKKYQATFKEMATCLNMDMGEFSSNQQMNYENFHKVISPDLGDVVTTSMEWTSTDIQTASGEVRRIYVEYGPDIDGPPKRTLKYYSISKNGAQKEIPLSNDQTYNPTDTFIAGLEADGKTVGMSMARKMFYQNGDDLLLVERNGKILSFELPHDGATFTCNNFDNSNKMSCRCQ